MQTDRQTDVLEVTGRVHGREHGVRRIGLVWAGEVSGAGHRHHVAQARAALGRQQIVPAVPAFPAVVTIIQVRALGRAGVGAVPDAAPRAAAEHLARVEVRLGELQGGVDLPVVRADEVGPAVVVPEGGRVVAEEVKVRRVAPRGRGVGIRGLEDDLSRGEG